MHEIRSALLSGEGGGRASPLIAPKRGRDKAEANSGSLTAIPVKRQQTRSRNERKEERLHGVVDAAILHFDGCKYDARVVNVSSQGTMVETTFSPWIGDSIQVQFADCNPTDCVVRWVRGGRLGLEFAEGTTILASLKIKKQIFGSAAVDRAQDGDKLQRPMASRPQRHGLTWTGTLYWSY